MNRRSRVAAVATAFAAVAATASGVTYAATAATALPSSVKACENGYGTLRLLSSTGTCARGYAKVSIGKVGPRGPQGVRGLTGPKGDQGIPGPGALSLLASSTAASDFHDQVVPGFGITARAVCAPGSQSSVYLMDSAASTNFDVRGTAVRSSNGSGLVVWSNGLSQNTAIPAGTSLQSYTQTATTQNAAFEVVNTGGDLSADLVVTRDGHTFTLTMYAVQSQSSCLVQAQVTPAS